MGYRLPPKAALETELASLLREKEHIQEELKQVFNLINEYQYVLDVLYNKETEKEEESK